MASGVDMKELVAWKKHIRRTRADINHTCNAYMNVVANTALSRVGRKTPVDTGFLISQWRKTQVRKRKTVHTISIQNEAYYASWVERGHRQHVGQFVPTIKKRLVRKRVPGKYFMKRGVNEFRDFDLSKLNKNLETAVERQLNSEVT